MFKSKNEVTTSKPLQLLHMDLFGPTQTKGLGGKSYAYVVVDDFSRLTWIMFLSSKDESFQNFIKLVKRIQRELDDKIDSMRNDHGGEFENRLFMEFCEKNEIHH